MFEPFPSLPFPFSGAAPVRSHSLLSVLVPIRSLVRVHVHPRQLHCTALEPHSGHQQSQVGLHLHPGGVWGGSSGRLPPQPTVATSHWASSTCSRLQNCSVTAWRVEMCWVSSRTRCHLAVALAGGCRGHCRGAEGSDPAAPRPVPVAAAAGPRGARCGAPRHQLPRGHGTLRRQHRPRVRIPRDPQPGDPQQFWCGKGGSCHLPQGPTLPGREAEPPSVTPGSPPCHTLPQPVQAM